MSEHDPIVPAQGQSISTRATTSVSVTVDHPRLNRADPESIRRFLNLYDQYANEVLARAKQLGTTVMGSEVSRPVDLKFCVDIEFIKSSISLGLIQGAECYESLTDDVLRCYLDEEAAESHASVTLSGLDNIIKRELKMDMRNTNASSRIKNLFIDYQSILRKHGLSWLVNENQKVAVAHVLSAIKPQKLKARLQSDLSFSHHDLRKDFSQFFKHARNISDAFQLVDSGALNDSSDGKPTTNGNGAGNTIKTKSGQNTHGNAKDSKTKNKEEPICLWPPHKERGLRHRLKDCNNCPDDEKKALFEDFKKEMAKDGPAKSTRSQKGASTSTSASSNSHPSKPTTGRLTGTSMSTDPSSPTCSMTVSDGLASIQVIGRCDDGSDDSIASARIAEAAVLKGIGRMRAISPVEIRVALTQGSDAQTFRFSKSWLAPRLVLHLANGQMALKNITFLVPDGEVACEEILIGLPVLRHLRIDSRTLLEANRHELDETDCLSVGNPTVNKAGSIGRLMIARVQCVKGSKFRHGIDYDKRSSQPFRDRPRVNYNDVRNERDPLPDPSLLDSIDSSQHSDVVEAVESMLSDAKKNGFPPEHYDNLHKLVYDYIDIFRVSFSSGPPARLPPLRIELTAESAPYKCRIRNYSPEQKQFMAEMVQELEATGMIFKNPTARWASAPLIVPKPGKAKFRFTVDLRAVNRFTIQHHFPMPILENELTKLSGSCFFSNFDLSHCYWQLPLHADSMDCQSFLTPDGVYSPTRVLHGTTNAVAHLQSSLQAELPPELVVLLLQWLDDLLLHSDCVKKLMEGIRLLFNLCTRLNLKLHPSKCILYIEQIRWCGRIIDANGWCFDPRNYNALCDLTPPTTGAHLQQFVCAMNWVRTAIPNHAKLVAPLQESLERVYARAKKRTRRGVARVQLSNIGWGPEQQNAFDECKRAVSNQVKLSHRDTKQRLCIYTDANDDTWSGMATQIPLADCSKSHVDQRHTPLSFLSGRFTATQLRWNVLEKEAYAVMATLTRLHWMVATPDGFDLFTDHNNLVFLFDPLSLLPDLSESSVRKVLRWAVRLSIYNYVCFHISGEDNVWADLLGRWSPPPTVRRLLSIPPLLSAQADDFVWPNKDELSNLQLKHANNRPPHLKQDEGFWRNDNGSIWVPETATDLHLRLCVIAHTSAGGHRGRDATERALRPNFYWKTMTPDIKLFVSSCIQCVSTTGGIRVPRPFGPAFHGSKPNALLQFDYLELGKSSTDIKYVLMLRDDHSNYCWLFPFANTNAENAAHAIVDWCAAFGIPGALMSDGPTHFRNETVRLVTKALKAPHHFTLPYCPWSNGAVERLGREIIRIARALLSEIRLRQDQWPDLIPILQSTLNQSPSPQRKNIAPITAFTGMAPTPPISTFMSTETSRPVTVSDAIRERVVNVKQLQQHMEQLHPVIQNTLQANRARARAAVERGDRANFSEGDFVLVAREEFHKGEKLCLRWRGPRRVIKAISEYIYQVEDLRNGALQDIHVTRLKFYTDAALNTKVLMPHIIASETGMQIQRLLRLEDSMDGIHVAVRWRGLPESEDTLEPLQHIYEDVPALLLKLLARKSTSQDLVTKARRVLGILEREM